MRTNHMRIFLIVTSLMLITIQSFSQGGWQQLSDFPGSARDDGAGFVLEDTLYVGTGLTAWWSTEADFYGYNMIDGNWFSIASLPATESRQYSVGFSSSTGKGFLFGGVNDTGFLNDLWMYNPVTNEWSELSALPEEGRAGSGSFVLNDTAYIVGGRTNTSDAISEVWAYSILSDSWVQKNNLPFGGRYRMSTTSLNNKGYLIFGTDENQGFRNELLEYDFSTDTWTLIDNFPSVGRTHAFITTYNNALHLGFGSDSLDIFHNDFWRYDLTTLNWVSLNGLPDLGRKGCVAISGNDGVYCITGVDEYFNRVQDNWFYSTSLLVNELDNNQDHGELIQIVNSLGQVVDSNAKGLLIYQYSDGYVEKIHH